MGRRGDEHFYFMPPPSELLSTGVINFLVVSCSVDEDESADQPTHTAAPARSGPTPPPPPSFADYMRDKEQSHLETHSEAPVMEPGTPPLELNDPSSQQSAPAISSDAGPAVSSEDTVADGNVESAADAATLVEGTGDADNTAAPGLDNEDDSSVM